MSSSDKSGERAPLLINVEEPNQTGLSKFWVEFKEALTKKENLIVLLYVVLYIVSGIANSILLKKTMNVFQNYPFFLNQLLNYGYIPIFGLVVVYQIIFTNNIPPEMRQFPWWKFLIMGTLDAINGYIVIIGGIDTSGPLQQLLNQAIIPFTMAGAFLFLKERYSWIQLSGALVIVGGVAVSLIPSFTGGDSGQNKIFFNVFYLMQAIPGAASNVYKDFAFKSVELDVWYLQFWDLFYQSIVGTFLFPINAILPEPATVEFSSVPDALKDGGLCLIGKNTIVNTTASQCGPDLSTPCDDCSGAIIVLVIYMAINVGYNVFILLVIKYGSATILSIAQTVRLPLTNVFFSFRFIMGDDVTPFSPLSIAGLIIILAGLVGYRVGSQLRRAAQGGDETGTRVVFNVYATEFQPIHKLLEPKSNAQLRSRYMNKLGIFPQNAPASQFP